MLNNASYEWLQHESVGRSAGLTTGQLLMIRFVPPLFNMTQLVPTLTPALAAVMAFTDAITVQVHVSDAIFDNLRNFLNDTQLVEAAATAGGYNFVSRFVVSLNVDAKMDVPVPVPT